MLHVRVGIVTKEWPPENYGGAGVHVEYLVRELRKIIDVDVQCFGAPRADATAYEVPAYLADANAALQTLGVDLAMADGAGARGEPDVMHSHTGHAQRDHSTVAASVRCPTAALLPLPLCAR